MLWFSPIWFFFHIIDCLRGLKEKEREMLPGDRGGRLRHAKAAKTAGRTATGLVFRSYFLLACCDSVAFVCWPMMNILMLFALPWTFVVGTFSFWFGFPSSSFWLAPVSFLMACDENFWGLMLDYSFEHAIVEMLFWLAGLLLLSALLLYIWYLVALMFWMLVDTLCCLMMKRFWRHFVGLGNWFYRLCMFWFLAWPRLCYYSLGFENGYGFGDFTGCEALRLWLQVRPLTGYLVYC